MRESDIEDYLIKRAEAMGSEVRKVQWIGRKFAPDRVLMLPKRDSGIPMCGPGSTLMMPGQTIWVEVKATGGLATFPKNAHERGQLREHERMRAMGQRVVVIDSLEGVEELLS